MRAVSDELIVTTDDGSHGRKDLVTAPLKEILEAATRADRQDLGHRTGHNDEVCRHCDQAVQCADDRQFEHHYGGRYGDVRRLPGRLWTMAPGLFAWTAPSSMLTKWTGTNLLSRMAFYRSEEQAAVSILRRPRVQSGHALSLVELNDMAELTKKERMKIPRQDMPVQGPKTGCKTFKKWPWALPLSLPRREAERCLQCKEPHCMEGCPVEVTIPEFIEAVRDGRYGQAVEDHERQKQPAGHLRQGLPTGSAVRVALRSGQKRANRSPSAASSVSWGTLSSQTRLSQLPRGRRPAKKWR